MCYRAVIGKLKEQFKQLAIKYWTKRINAVALFSLMAKSNE